jgi:ribosome modulation factor
MSITQHSLPLVFESGVQAFHDGKRRGWDCPYVADPWARRSWQAGWEAARETRRAQIVYLIATEPML